MNKYILYTTEGYCEAPNGESIDNCQHLGRVMATDDNEAVEKFVNEHPWFLENGYDPGEICIAQLHDSEEIW